mmetsp:Transcript_2354/g.5617  ORF Transcript_2354/g.5617 Transcript_2354/m.5617 type:complete len:237 (-) Transcript_2354:168-878(-)
MGGVTDSVGNQIVHVEVGRIKVHFKAKCPGSLVVQSHFHFLKDFQVAFGACVAIASRENVRRGNGGFFIGIPTGVPGQDTLHGQVSLNFHLRLGHVAAIGQSLLDEDDGQVVEFLEVVATVSSSFGCPSEPFQIVHKGVDVFLRFGVGIRVVVSKDSATVFRSDAEFVKGQRKVHVDGLGVTHMQISVGFRRKAGANDGSVDLRVLCKKLRGVLGPCDFTGRQRIGGCCRGSCFIS